MTRKINSPDRMIQGFAMLVLLIILGVSAILLAGCDVSAVPKAQIPAICKAMIGPLRYNSTDKLSKRYAGYILAMDLAERNRIYTALHCPKD